jgi:hypothetical protein
MEYIVFTYIIFLLGLSLVLHFIFIFFLSKQTKKWTPTESTIVTSELEVTNLGIGDSGSVSYKANIKYQYMVKGIMYSSKRIFVGDYIRRNTSFRVKAIKNKYFKGKTLLVYYNPEYPKKAVIEIGVHAVIYRELLAGVLFIFLSIIMLVKKTFFISLLVW